MSDSREVTHVEHNRAQSDGLDHCFVCGAEGVFEKCIACFDWTPTDEQWSSVQRVASALGLQIWKGRKNVFTLRSISYENVLEPLRIDILEIEVLPDGTIMEPRVAPEVIEVWNGVGNE